jgi:L-rhamnose mutarotase
MNRHTLVFALDLADDPELIAEYEVHHEPGNVWPEILNDIRASGIHNMQIWRTGSRLVMTAEVDDDYPREHPREPKVDAWEELMWKFQRALTHAKPGQKWAPMKKIFDLAEHSPDR